MVKSRPKVLLWNAWNVLTRLQSGIGQILYIEVGDNQIATSAKLLDVKYKFCGFSDDLIESII